jgi:hypothetical protein
LSCKKTIEPSHSKGWLEIARVDEIPKGRLKRVEINRMEAQENSTPSLTDVVMNVFQ